MEQYKNNYGMKSIHNRIIFFALLLTIAPSLTMGWFLNNILQAALTEKTEQKLLASSNIIEREIALWFKERYYDLYVFSNSTAIAEYLEDSTANSDTPRNQPLSLRAVETHLKSLQQQFEQYQRLYILEANGSVIAASAPEPTGEAIPLPDELEAQVAATSSFQGAAFFNESNAPVMLIGIPLFKGQANVQSAGYLAVEVSLDQLFALIEKYLGGPMNSPTMHYSLTDVRTGVHLFSTNVSDLDQTAARIPYGTIKSFGNSAHLKDFFDERGIRVIGVINMLNDGRWEFTIAEDHGAIFARSIQARRRNMLITFCLTMVIGVSASLFARQIIIPLRALRDGAKKVAEGNLNVSLPVSYKDELGFTTRVFNEMVQKLRLSQHKLEQLATIDSLTQLNNRKRIMQVLKNHFNHFQRYRTTFCALMIDVDHFKEVNDTYSHLAGDEVLRQLARVFDRVLRSVDSAGRYGGEEFLIILAETDGNKAEQVAERIRKTIAERSINYRKMTLSVTVSIGIAEISLQDENEEKLVARADEALYHAKNSGRNRVALHAG